MKNQNLGTNWAVSGQCPELGTQIPVKQELTNLGTSSGGRKRQKKISPVNPKSGHPLGTDWTLPRFEDSNPFDTSTYESGHHFPGEKEAKIKSQELILAYQEYRKTLGLRAWKRLVYDLGPLADWLEDRGLDCPDLTPAGAEDYQTYLATLEDGEGLRYTSRTVAVMIASADGLYQWLKSRGSVATNPFYRMKRIKREHRLPRQVPTVEEMARALARLKDFARAPTLTLRRQLYRLHVISEVLYASGLRLSELAILQESDVDWDRGMLRVREGKGGRERTAFLGDYATRVLKQYVERMGPVMVRGDAVSLWGTSSGKSLDSSLNAVMKQELGWTSHMFRHALGTHLLQRGCDLRMIQMILGHEDLKSTAIYAQVSKEDLRLQLDTYHPRGG